MYVLRYLPVAFQDGDDVILLAQTERIDLTASSAVNGVNLHKLSTPGPALIKKYLTKPVAPPCFA